MTFTPQDDTPRLGDKTNYQPGRKLFEDCDQVKAHLGGDRNLKPMSTLAKG